MSRIQRPVRRRRTRSQWEDLILEQSRSGLSMRAFCERHEVGLSSFENWRRKTQAPPTARFIEMTLEPGASGHDQASGFDIEVELPHGLRIRVGPKTSVERVRDLVTALKEIGQPC